MDAPADVGVVASFVERHGRGPDACIAILQAIQSHYRYLPREALQRVCELTDIAPAQIAGVSTFYTQFRHRPVGKHIIHVCHGTACHVKGSELVHEALERHLRLSGGRDTDDSGTFTVEKVACVGCCTLAPVVVVDSATFGHTTPGSVSGMLREFLANEAGRKAGEGRAAVEPLLGDVPEIRIGVGSCCIANGSLKVREAMEKALRETGMPVNIRPVGCVGMCHRTPLVEIVWPGGGRGTKGVESALAKVHAERGEPVAAGAGGGERTAVYAQVVPEKAERIVRRHFKPKGLARRVKSAVASVVGRVLDEAAWEPAARYEMDVRDGQVCAFLGRQVRIATEHCGSLDPLDLDSYVAHGGFEALRKVVGELGPEKTIADIQRSGLRGRGGAGFPAGKKWALARASKGETKYILCNGDEGDPGAFMDRMILESYPYRVLEGMAIAAFAIGAREGYLYIRAEYPLAVIRVREALRRLEARGLLGGRMLDGRCSLTLSVKEGAGAFVCGEETAMIASIEGRRGMPRVRPPFPAEKGLWGVPTCVNNVETLALVPWIVRQGPDAFAALGTEKSKGTKVFALAGKIRRGGLIEVPMGITIRQVVEEIGGGVGPGRTFKAVQIGGPSGGCIPAAMADIPVDYDALTAAGAIMGSGGLVVMDDRDCMVDIARYFLKFTQDQSCGKCTFCRIGTKRMLEILERMCEGLGTKDDLAAIEELALRIKRTSLCGLGKTAPNPVLTTLRYFRAEYEAHIEGRCPAGRCKALISYRVGDRCIGCTRCAQSCPADAIEPNPYERQFVEDGKCVRCGTCRDVCPNGAIEVVPRAAPPKKPAG